MGDPIRRRDRYLQFSHIDKDGRATMVDIGSKELCSRKAVAEGRLFISPGTAKQMSGLELPKGDPVEVARIAGIQAAKETARLIPLCHAISLDHVDVEITLKENCFEIRATASCRWATGVEMEALTAVSVTALTLYDMCKAVDKEMQIGEIRLVEKRKAAL
jgi:cyclic pyranopterin phosphate synthase